MDDLLVIGAGLAGLTAALAAAQAGLKVSVIAKGMGALHWCAGTVDVLGYAAAGEPVTEPFSAVKELPTQHPYARMGTGALQDSLAWFQAKTVEAGVEYIAPDKRETNFWLPSPVGAKRPAYLIPAGQKAGNLESHQAIVIVGFRGMRDFFPDLVASNLRKQGIAARAARIPVDVITDRHDFNTVHLAQALERSDARQRLGRQLAAIVEAEEKIGLPAVLGLQNHAAVLAELRETAEADIFEIPTLPPSVPGIRLHRALCQRLEAFGVRVETGMEVMGFHADNSVIRWIETETSSRPLRHHAEAFLLATGGVLGGGFSSDVSGRFWEDVFNLPLFAPTSRNAWFRTEFLDPRGHPIFQAGVEVNDEFQPVDASGQPVYDNLWAAGGALAHADPIRERSLEGLAISTGYRAANALVSRVARRLAST